MTLRWSWGDLNVISRWPLGDLEDDLEVILTWPWCDHNTRPWRELAWPTRSVDRSVGWSVGRSVGRSVERLIAYCIDHKTLNFTVNVRSTSGECFVNYSQWDTWWVLCELQSVRHATIVLWILEILRCLQIINKMHIRHQASVYVKPKQLRGRGRASRGNLPGHPLEMRSTVKDHQLQTISTNQTIKQSINQSTNQQTIRPCK